MRKPDQTQLDEMQQGKLLKIHSNGMNLCYIGLLAAILIQWLVKRDFSSIIGEGIIFFALVIYVACAYLYEGIWDSRLKPSMKTNLLVSLLPAAAVGILLFVRNILSTKAQDTVAISVILLAMIAAYALCLLVLSMLLWLYKHRRNLLDEQEDC